MDTEPYGVYRIIGSRVIFRIRIRIRARDMVQRVSDWDRVG